AEDGIRDRTVTGVQTCALPIWFADDVPHVAQHARTDRDGDRLTCVLDRRPPAEAVRGLHGDGPYPALADVLGDLGRDLELLVLEIGRASCRERVEIPAGDVDLK